MRTAWERPPRAPTRPAGTHRDSSGHDRPGASHVYRKTVATLMDGAGLSARQAADQLGHSEISMTQDFYFGRKMASTGAKDVLEVFGDKSTP